MTIIIQYQVTYLLYSFQMNLLIFQNLREFFQFFLTFFQKKIKATTVKILV